jgi:O-antigen/teichoic acid export membrane protein
MTAVSKIGVALAAALAMILIARVLGPGGSGAFFLAQSLLLLLTIGVSLGVENGIIYFVGSGRWDPRWALNAALRFAVVMGCVGAAIGIALRLLVPSAFDGLPTWLVAVTVAGLPFGLAWVYSSIVALATDRYEGFVVPPLAQALGTLVLATLGAHVRGVEGAVLGMTASTAIVGIGTVMWANGAIRSAEVSEPTRLREAIAFGLKGYAANCLQLLNARLDLFVLASVASAASVGQYSVAVAVTSVLMLLPNSLADVLYPRVARLHGVDEGALGAELELVETKSVRFASTIAVFGAVVLALALIFFVVPVFGAKFRPSIALGLILLPGTVALAIGGVLWSSIIGRGRPLYSLYTSLVVTPITIALYVWLIPQLDATGAAVASTISYSLSFTFASLFYFRVTGRRVYRLLTPSRSEFDDIRALPGAVRAYVRALR